MVAGGGRDDGRSAEAADFDAELDAVRSQVLANPRVTADVVKLWMRA
jgi:flagellar M-ring protein FliF